MLLRIIDRPRRQQLERFESLNIYHLSSRVSLLFSSFYLIIDRVKSVVNLAEITVALTEESDNLAETSRAEPSRVESCRVASSSRDESRGFIVIVRAVR